MPFLYYPSQCTYTYKYGSDVYKRQEEYRALLDTDFSDVKINEMPDMASYHPDLNDTIETRQQKFIRKVGNPYMMRVGKMKVKVRDVYKRQILRL